MTLLRRAILALALIAGLTPAFGQAPGPVPALPDTERRTSYSISGSTCACNVNFALFGEGFDYGNWIEVFVNGVLVPQVGNWGLTSPTGPIQTLPRPITDAVLTFVTAQTGTVQIVGARRPRRISQFAENQGVSARNFNQVLTDIIAQNRENWDKTNDVTGRAILAPPGETLSLLAAANVRANSTLGFDALGNIGLYSPASGVTTAANVNFLQAGTGAISRTVQAELRDTIKAQQFGELCDGITDDAPAVQRAITFADSIGGPTVQLCAGTTRWSSTPFLNKWAVPGTLTVPGLKIRGQGKDVTKIDTRVANGYAIAVNPDWKAAFQALSGITATTGGSGALATNTYWVQITMNTPAPVGDEVLVTLPASIAVTGPTGRITITLPAVNTGYTYNIYIGTTSTPANYAIVGGNNASAINGGQTLQLDAIGLARAVPTNKPAVWQNARISDLSIINPTAAANASGVLFFKTGYAGLDNVLMNGLTGNGFDVPNYIGDIDGSFNVSVTNSKFDTIAGTCVNAAGTHLELSNFYVSDTIFNLCGTSPANLNTNFTISAITNASPGVITTTGSHTLAANDQIFVNNLAGGTFSTLNNTWYRVCPTSTQAVTATTFGLCNIGGGNVDTSALGSYTASSGTESLSWRPPTATANNSGGLVWMGLIGTFRNLDFTQNKNFSMYFTEAGTSDNATIENVDFENTVGKGLYAASLAGGTLSNFECLTQIAFGSTISCVQLGTGFAGGGVQNFKIGPGKVRSDVTPSTAFEQFQNTNNTGAFSDTVRLGGINYQSFDAAGQFRTNTSGFTFDPIPGQVKFSISAVNTAKLVPTGIGAALPIHLKANGEWVAIKIPNVGVTFATGTLSATTTYNFYAYNSAATSAPAVVAMEASTTAATLSDGYLVKTGDATRTFVGTAKTDGSGNFQTSGAQTSQYPPSSLPVGTNGQFLAGVTGADPAFVTMSQDCTTTAAGVITCTKTNNVSFTGPATAAYAAKADMQTPTSSTLVVNPRDVQDHPGTAKFWARLDGKTGSTCTIGASYNISGCVRNSAGNYTITFSTAFTSTQYAAMIGGAANTGVSPALLNVATAGYATGTLTFTCTIPNGAVQDCDSMAISGYGTQ